MIIVTLPSIGRFVWDAERATLEWFEVGARRKPRTTWSLTPSENTFEGAVRTVGRILRGFQRPRGRRLPGDT